MFMMLKSTSTERETLGIECHATDLKREAILDFGLLHCTVLNAISLEASAQIQSVCI